MPMTKKLGNICIKVLTALVLTSCAEKSILFDDRAELGLKGPVRSVYITAHEMVNMDGELMDDGLWYQRTMEFSEQGQLTRVFQDGEERYAYTSHTRTVERFDIDGELDTKEVTLYTDHGDILSWTQYDASNTILSQETYTYDRHHHCIEKSIYSPYSFNLVCRDYTYDAQGRKTGYTAYASDDKVSYGWRCSYDSIGRVVREEWLTTEGKVSGSSTFEYNEQGFVSVETTDDKYTNTYTYEYDEHGNWISKITVYSGGYDRPSYAIEERTIVYY